MVGPTHSARCSGEPVADELEPRGGDAGVARHVAEALRPVGDFSVRRLGRLYGLFLAGLIPDVPVGVVEGGDVYLKAGPEGVTRYIAAGMRPFRPGPRQVLRGYWRVPADVLVDAPTLCAWAATAVDAVIRFGRRRRALRRRRPKNGA